MCFAVKIVKKKMLQSIGSFGLLNFSIAHKIPLGPNYVKIDHN